MKLDAKIPQLTATNLRKFLQMPPFLHKVYVAHNFATHSIILYIGKKMYKKLTEFRYSRFGCTIVTENLPNSPSEGSTERVAEAIVFSFFRAVLFEVKPRAITLDACPTVCTPSRFIQESFPSLPKEGLGRLWVGLSGLNERLENVEWISVFEYVRKLLRCSEPNAFGAFGAFDLSETLGKYEKRWVTLCTSNLGQR